MRWMEKRRPDSAEMLSGVTMGHGLARVDGREKKAAATWRGKADSAVITLARAPSAVPLSGQMIASLAAWPEPAPLPSPLPRSPLPSRPVQPIPGLPTRLNPSRAVAGPRPVQCSTALPFCTRTSSPPPLSCLCLPLVFPPPSIANSTPGDSTKFLRPPGLQLGNIAPSSDPLSLYPSVSFVGKQLPIVVAERRHKVNSIADRLFSPTFPDHDNHTRARRLSPCRPWNHHQNEGGWPPRSPTSLPSPRHPRQLSLRSR